MRPLRQRLTAGVPGGESALRWASAALVWLMVLSVCLPDAYTYAGPVNAEDNPIRRGLWVVAILVAGVVLVQKSPVAIQVVRRVNIFLWLWLILAIGSFTWSIDADLTGRKLVRLMIMCTAFLAVGVAAWERHRFQHILRPLLTLVCVASIVFALGWPDLALHHEPFPELLDAWHGVCLTKNQLGSVASFTFILWVHAWITQDTRRSRAALGAGAAMVCLVMSRSQTSLISGLLASAVIVLMLKRSKFRRRNAPLIIGVLAVCLMLFALAMLRVIPGLEVILAPIPWLTGKDLTFSNRAQIWAVVVEHIKYRPLLGSGYGAFWVPNDPTPDQESYYVISQLNGLYPGSSHNGYLQVLNDLGSFGLAFLLGYIFVFFRQSLRLYKFDPTQGALFVALLVQQTCINMEEPSWFNSIMVDFVPMSVATVCLARALLETRVAQPRPVRAAVAASPAPVPGRRFRTMRDMNNRARDSSAE